MACPCWPARTPPRGFSAGIMPTTRRATTRCSSARSSAATGATASRSSTMRATSISRPPSNPFRATDTHQITQSIYMADIDCIVLGAGVVGLAIARELSLAGREVLVAEAAEGIGTGCSARNSEVIHAGIYYTANSLKARLCVEGKQMLYEYCSQRGIAHKRLGKLIVAADPQQAMQLDDI